MLRTLWMVMLGTTFLVPAEAEAQRARGASTRDGRAVAPVGSARLVSCPAPSGARAYRCAPEVRRRVGVRPVAPVPRVAQRTWVSAGWRGAPIFLTWRDLRRAELGQGRLRQILGRPTLDGIADHGRRAGMRGPVRGHWARGRWAGTVLVLTMRGGEVARLVDYDRDGLVDDLLLRNFRRWSARDRRLLDSEFVEWDVHYRDFLYRTPPDRGFAGPALDRSRDRGFDRRDLDDLHERELDDDRGPRDRGQGGPVFYGRERAGL